MTLPKSISNPADLKQISLNELAAFADRVRGFLIDTISKTGGHIGANLGTVDLSIALHYVFDSPRDKIIWDTGHQGYTHKLITGRADLFPTLNSYGGMNRFVTPKESEHDIIEASHAGTSLSIALGMALSMKINKSPHHVIAVIGDGAICEGMALEALNHIGVEEDIKLIIILNDNGYAISPGFGAIHDYLQKRVVGTDKEETFLSSMNLDYFGPVNGHNIEQMINVMEEAKKSNRVTLIHVKTKKGYGLPCSKDHPNKMHFSFPFDPETGTLKQQQATTGYQDIAASVIKREMEEDEKIVAITPSTLYATGLQPAFKQFPDRCFDPGMEEQHAMTMAAGFALGGMKPVIFYQATFMQRAFDQLVHDVCFMNLPVMILTVRCGFAGYDNATHHGIYDFAYMRAVPNLRILYPKDRYELERMVYDNLHRLNGPILIEMPYGPVDEFDNEVLLESEDSFNQAQEVFTGEDLMIIVVGHKYGVAYAALEELRRRGIDTGLVNLRYLKPLPEKQLLALMKQVKRVVTIEEAVLDGGVGSAIATLAADYGVKCGFLRIGLPCKFVEPGSNNELCTAYGLDINGVVEKIKSKWPELNL